MCINAAIYQDMRKCVGIQCAVLEHGKVYQPIIPRFQTAAYCEAPVYDRYKPIRSMKLSRRDFDELLHGLWLPRQHGRRAQWIRGRWCVRWPALWIDRPVCVYVYLWDRLDLGAYRVQYGDVVLYA